MTKYIVKRKSFESANAYNLKIAKIEKEIQKLKRKDCDISAFDLAKTRIEILLKTARDILND